MKTKILLLLLITIGMGACSNFDDMNTNNNKPSPDDPRFADYDFNKAALSSILRGGATYDGAEYWQRVKSLHIDLYSQMLDESGSGWVNTRNYLRNDGWTVGYWGRVQQWVIRLNLIIKQGQGNPAKANSVAVAKIWRVYVQSQACDLFGVMPFPSYKSNEANPPYVSVENQYTEFFAELDAAAKLLDPKVGFMNGKQDMIFKGDVNKWKMFANSLRLRLALRLSEVKPDVCKQQAQAAIDGGVITSVSEEAKCPPSNVGWGNDYNYTLLFGWGETQHMTTSFEKLVTNIGGVDWPASYAATVKPAKVDPRAVVMFNPSVSGFWRGVTPGLHPDNVNNGENKASEKAILGTFVVGPEGSRNLTRAYDMLLFEEVCFLKAEAAARGFITGVNAKAEYERGVRSSFARWGATNVDAYLASTEKNVAGTSASYDDVAGAGNTVLEKIITQKYLANFPDVSIEGWSDKRRLNLPRMDVPAYRDPSEFASAPSDIKNSRSFVKRVRIPLIESANNTVEYNKGVALMGPGGDKATTNIWWDVNANHCTSAN